MKQRGLSHKSRKAINEAIGEAAGTELAELISQLAAEVESLRRVAEPKSRAPVQTIGDFHMNVEQTN